MAIFEVEWATRLAAQVTAQSLTLATNLFAGQLAKGPDDQVACQVSGEVQHVEVGKKFSKIRLQTTVRWTSYTAGLALARDIASVSDRLHGVTLTDWVVHRALVTAGAQYIGRGGDGGRYHFFTVNSVIDAFDTS